MLADSAKIKKLAVKLFDINAFKFGDFKMKVGVNSPVYFDLRVIVSHPDVMEEISSLMHDFINQKQLQFKSFCGVPYTALPIATILSVKGNVPMLIRRKEAKDYGTKKLIEGKYTAGDVCLIIEDVVTSGSSVLDTTKDLRKEGIKVTDAIVVVDREQGGSDNIQENGITMHSLFKLSDLLNMLQEAGKIEQTTVEAVRKYIAGCQIKSDGSFANDSVKFVNKLSRVNMSFENRIDLAKCSVTKKLFGIMAEKKTNLCVAVDLTTTEEILNVTEAIAPYICVLKTHVDIIEDFNMNFIKSLQSLAEKHKFLIMEDRKFADIGNTVSHQYHGGLFRISSWADLVVAHTLPGPGIIQGLKSKLPTGVDRGVVLLAEMSSEGNLIDAKYTEATMKMASDDTMFVAGIVGQDGKNVGAPGLIQFTPGVKIEDRGDELGQQYNSPESVIKEKGADIGIVGRGVIGAKSPEASAELYRNQLWTAYTERINASE